ncbi:hypothetical protein D9M71_790540 [compost metagenome]
MADRQLLFEAGIHAQLHREPRHDQREHGQARQHRPTVPEQDTLDAWQHPTRLDISQFYRAVHGRPQKVREIAIPT